MIAAGVDRDGDLVQYADEFWKVVRVDRWTAEAGNEGLIEADLIRVEGQEFASAQRAFSAAFSTAFAQGSGAINTLPLTRSLGAAPWNATCAGTSPWALVC